MQEMTMTTKHTLSVLAIMAAIQGSTAVSAGENTTPFYDEDSDTVVYHFVGGPNMSVRSPGAMPAKDQSTPYYDEDTDTVVYPFTGSPATPDRSPPASSAAGHTTPYYEEDTDTVVYPYIGRRVMQTTAMTGGS
jgi:hypothetical protein